MTFSFSSKYDSTVTYPLFDPIETTHSEAEVKDNKRETHHQNCKVAGNSFGYALHVTI